MTYPICEDSNSTLLLDSSCEQKEPHSTRECCGRKSRSSCVASVLVLLRFSANAQLDQPTPARSSSFGDQDSKERVCRVWGSGLQAAKAYVLDARTATSCRTREA